MQIIEKPFYYFYSVVKYNGFRKASEKLFISQPSISKQVSILEKELGYPLLKRTHNQVILTEEGKLLYHLLQLVIDMTQSLEKSIQLLNQSEAQILTLGIVSGWNPNLFRVPLIAALKKQAPDLRIHFERRNYLDLIYALERELIDFAIIPFYEVRDHPKLSYYPFYDMNMKIVISRNSPYSDLDDIGPVLHKLPLYMHPNTLFGLPEMLNRLKKCGINYTECIIVPNIDSMMVATEQEDGFTIMAECSNFYLQPNIKIYDIGLYDKLVIAYKNRVTQSPLHNFVIQTLAEIQS